LIREGDVLSEKIVMATIQGVRDARKVEEREYRPVPSAGIEVARGGRIRLGEDYPEIDRFPFLLLPGVDGLYRAHVPASVALSWTTPEERDRVRSAFPDGVPRDADGKQRIDAFVRDLNLWKWAVQHIAVTAEEELVVLDEVPVEDWSGRAVTRVTDVAVADYRAYLVEAYRPPSKGGNTTALHSHVFHVDGDRYSFFSRGSRKWIHAKDRVSFDYVTTEEGYRNVLPASVVVTDAKGNKVQRGLRGWKPTLRSAPAQLPASRREQRD